jgi:hypothetical protein
MEPNSSLQSTWVIFYENFSKFSSSAPQLLDSYQSQRMITLQKPYDYASYLGFELCQTL